MKRTLRQYLTIAVFILALGGFSLLNLFTDAPRMLESERRAPAAFPEFSYKTFSNASFMSGFEKWAQDGFAMRESLRTIRAAMVFYAFRQTDKERLYIGASGAGRFERIDEVAWRQSVDKIGRMAGRLQDGTIADVDMDFYAAVIPDKSLYAGRYLPGYDPAVAGRLMSEGLPADVRVIDLTEALAPQDFYTTDLHWDQTRIDGVMDALMAAMGAEVEVGAGTGDPAYAEDRVVYAEDRIEYAGAFFGAYAGQVALPMAPDALSYVSNHYIDTAEADYLNPRTAAMEAGSVYYPGALTGGGDPYDFFLGGPQPLIILSNPEQQNEGRVLYLFRDSFGSSIAPLFLRYYDRVELIDLRYIDSRILGDYAEFEPGADVLFLYSSQILGSPTTLLVN